MAKKETAKEIHSRRTREYVLMDNQLHEIRFKHGKNPTMVKALQHRWLSQPHKSGSKFTRGDRMNFLESVLSTDRANPEAAHKKKPE